MKKVLSSIINIMLVVLLTSGSVVKADGPIARAPTCQYSKSYIASTTSTNQPYSITTGYYENNTDTTQTAEISLTRSVTYTGTTKISAERELMVAKIGISAETSFGSTYTVSYKVSTAVPAYKTYYVDVGSVINSTSGYMKTINTDCSTTSKYVSIKYTSGPYVKWYK